MQLRRCQPSESLATAAWLKELHYLGCCPPGFVHVLEFTEGRELIGAMLIGRTASKSYDSEKILELSRMYFVDSPLAPINTESQALSMMRRHVRVWLPGIRLLVAYSDPTQGHQGKVYEADGWAPFGMTGKHGGYGWRSREGRRDMRLSSKQRWVRTP